jgi:hypothetical protein
MGDALGLNDTIITCVRCQSEWLHHCAIDIHARIGGEDGVNVVTRHYGTGIPTDNPSCRRDGLVIQFYCEHCDAVTTEVTLAQHKGQSLMVKRPATKEFAP